MQKYFQKFPTTTYNGLSCVDITERVVLQNQKVMRSPNVFYPLVLKAGIRPDSIADAYYGDAEMDWLIWLGNNIVDPYYEWYMDELQFGSFINQKYGDLETAEETIKFWRNNWASDPNEISPGQYNNYFPDSWKQYYEPNWGVGAKIISYSRTKADWTVATNQILSYALSYSQGNSYTAGEIIDLTVGPPPGIIVGNGTTIVSNSTTLVVQHVSGNTMANSSLTLGLTGEESNTISTSNAMSVVYSVISNDESKFWSSVSCYDYEVELNEQKKFLQIVAKNYAPAAAEALRQALKS